MLSLKQFRNSDDTIHHRVETATVNGLRSSVTSYSLTYIRFLMGLFATIFMNSASVTVPVPSGSAASNIACDHDVQYVTHSSATEEGPWGKTSWETSRHDNHNEPIKTSGVIGQSTSSQAFKLDNRGNSGVLLENPQLLFLPSADALSPVKLSNHESTTV